MKKILLLISNFFLLNIITSAQDVVLTGPTNCGVAAISSTWQVPCGVSSITVEVYGAGGSGGGGGGGSMGGVCDTYGAGGGGGGGYTSITINVTQGASFSYTIGAGGCGGSNGGDLSNGGNGSAGGNSTFSGTDSGGNTISLIANGGARGNRGEGCNPFGGGGGSGSGGAGGSASGGTTNTTGSAGGNGIRRSNSSIPSETVGGTGGNGAGPLGGAGGPETSAIGSNYGGGGAGGGDSAGGRGASGAILITFNGTVTTPPTPVINSTPPNCTADGSSTISNFSATATYVFTPAGPNVVTGGAINGMTLGTNYTVIASENGCDSDPSASFSNLAQVPPPSAPVISTSTPSCTNNGVSTITNFNASLTYSFSPTGPTVGAGGVISGMIISQNYTVSSTDGVCNSTVSNQFSIEGQLPGPSTPTISNTPPNCTTASTSTISNYNTSATYDFIPAGPTVGAGGVINGMTLGTSYTVTSTEIGCTSAQSASFLNIPATPVPPSPTVSVSEPTCSVNGFAQITNYNSFVTYLFTPSGPSVAPNGDINGINFNTAYTIVASDGACNSTPSNSFTVLSQLPKPTASVSGNLSYCIGNNTNLIASGGTNYVWYNSTNTSIGNNASISLNQGSYFVVVSNIGGCSDTANVNIAELPLPIASILGETEICQGSSTLLTASGGNSYSWNSGQSSESITVSSAGNYTVQVTDVNGCSSNANIEVTQFSTAPINLGPSVLLCKDSLLVLDAGAGYLNYEWNTGDTTQSITPIFSNTYSVTAIDNNGCESTGSIDVEFEDCLPPCKIFIPNAFTPQSDGVNDLFLTYSECEPIFFQLSIFNRWGEMLFKTNDFFEGWDGTFKGENSLPGVYTYYVNYQFETDQNEQIKKGSISLLK